MDKMAEDQGREAAARAMLGEIATGGITLDRFTPEARWWWNGGLDLPVAEFSALLGTLHGQMAHGILIVPRLVLARNDSMVVEATTHSRLKDGRVYDNRYLFLIHFDRDLIREVREYSDSAHVLATFDLSGN